MDTIYIRKATEQDVKAIMTIIHEAKQLLKEDGSQQWQNGSPNEEIIKNDIERGYGYVLLVGNEVAGTAALLTDPDPCYEEIFDGSWENKTSDYATIHRIALAKKYRGIDLASFFLSNLLSLSYSEGFRYFRIDTHERNIRTQGLIQKFGFEYRGQVYVDSSADGARKAYELHLS